MDLSDYMSDINLKEELIPTNRKNRKQRPLKPTKLTIHNTSNTAAGADAKAHSNFVRNTGYYVLNGAENWISWHYTVDDKVAIRQLPETEQGVHAHGTANACSLAIEICMHQGIDQAAANIRAQKLAAYILYTNGMDVGDLMRHYDWTQKQCPTLLMKGNGWEQFKEQVAKHLAQLRGNPGMHLHAALEPTFEFHFEGCAGDFTDE